MQRIQAVFADVDGTLFSHKTKCVPESAQRAVYEAREKGILVFVATGRHEQELKDLGFAIDLDGWITLNGSLCFNKERVYHEAPICTDDLKILVEEMKRNPFPCQFLERNITYISMESKEVRQSLAEIHTPYPVVLDPVRSLTEKTYMIIPWVKEETWQPIFSRMKQLKYTRWTPLAVDAMSMTSGKARGALETCRHYGIDPKNTLAIGDGPNDIELFEACGLSVAMGNSRENVKMAADIVTDDIDKDGFAKALEVIYESN